MKPDLKSVRARKARLGQTIGQLGFDAMRVFIAAGFICAAILFVLSMPNLAMIALFVSFSLLLPATWYHLELKELPSTGASMTDRLDHELLARLKPDQTDTPQQLWQSVRKHWQNWFILNHLYVDPNALDTLIADDDVAIVWEQALNYAGDHQIHVGHITAALLKTTSALLPYLQSSRVEAVDIDAAAAWFNRVLDSRHIGRPYFGGIGRDWANGFTPRLNHFGHNISLDIETHGAHFNWLSSAPNVKAIKTAFSQGSAAVALVGEDGVGKTSHVGALAQALLQEQTDRHLEHRQIISLNPSVLLSNVQHQGDLEHLLLLLVNEAAHAGHIILFFDDAHLFFQNGNGSVDLTQILMPVIQSHAVQMIFAMTPRDLQLLKTSNSGFANLLNQVTLQEPSADEVMRILEDAALRYEHRHGVLITYEALKEAYRLSGRYNQDQAYPGRALQLLEQSLQHANDHQVVLASSVQAAIEQSRGVKVSAANPAEVDQLLNLESAIHERMINQSQAVSVVANALRRARAGIANPRRPIGSFLFLGPTGVGKTELAKSVAATFFGAEDNIIRLDMSEYQQPDDVQRLLHSGADSSSLILAVRQQPYSVVLLDELEKAHPNVLNLLLQMLDEGQLTDMEGRAASFKDCVIIATSNAGAQLIRETVQNGSELDDAFERTLTDQLIGSGQFKAELLNRFDEIVMFKPLEPTELLQIVDVMLREINQTLQPQNISIQLTREAAEKIVDVGYDARLGARPLRRVLQRAVEDTVADRILKSELQSGDTAVLDVHDLRI